MIELQNVDFAYETGTNLFRGLSVSFANGKTTAILGPSGSGKTTIIRLVCGLLRPDGGTVIVDGTSVQGPGTVRGVLFQDDTLVPWLSTLENAVFPRDLKTAPEQKARAVERLGAVGLGDALTKLPHQLSLGMKKRLEFIRATLADERFIVADEPFNGLDFHQKRALWEQWRNLMKGGDRTGIIVTHDPSEAVALADRIVVLSATTPCTITLDTALELSKDSIALESAIVNALLSFLPVGGDFQS